MPKGTIYFSWEALDFDYGYNKERVNPDGPTVTLHKKKVQAQDYHVLFYTNPNEKNTKRINQLKEAIIENTKTKPNQIHLKALSVNDPYDLVAIKQHLQEEVQRFHDEYPDYDLAFLASNGTTAMRIAWAYLQLDNFRKAKILIGIEDRYLENEGGFRELPILEQTFAGRTVFDISNIRLDKRKNDNIILYPTLERIYKERLLNLADYDIRVLINGESGSGKEDIAIKIHDFSKRKNKPFKALNCAAFTDELFLSELFGYKSGAFTGANKDKVGLLKECDGGTVFLDEIGELSKMGQARLLRFLQDGTFYPVGESKKEEKVNVRIISATHRNLTAMCENGDFRWDLYFRIAEAGVVLPAFRELPVAERQFIVQEKIKQEQDKLLTNSNFSPEAIERLVHAPLKGNLRQLEAIIKQALILFPKGTTITAQELESVPLLYVGESTEAVFTYNLEQNKEALEQKLIRKAAQNFRTKKEMCEALGLAFNTLEAKLKKYTIEL